MHNMHKLGAIKDPRILAHLHIGTNKATHPIIGRNNGRENLQLAASLERSQCKEDQLLGHVHGSLAVVGPGEELRVVEPDVVYPLVLACVDPELLDELGCLDFYVTVVDEPVSS